MKPHRSHSPRQRSGSARRSSVAKPEPPELSPEQITENFLERIAQGAELCRKIETQLRQHPAPELETIIKWYRLLVLRLSAEVQAVPELRHLLSALMRPVMEWARLEEKRKDRDSAEQRHREETAARNGARSGQADRDRALQPETLERIERELTLF